MGFIYKITNAVNGKVYIGQTTVNIAERWKWHKCAFSTTTRKTKSALYDAMKKYGIENFFIEEVEECDDKDLDEREKHWISELNTMRSGYNLTIGGRGHNPIYALEKNAIVRHWKDGLTQKEISELTGREHKLVARILREAGVTREDFLARQAARNLERAAKRVYVYDMAGNFLQEYASVKEAAQVLKIHASTIGHIVHGRDAYSNGYVFRDYKADKIEETSYTEHPKRIMVYQYDLNGALVQEYPSSEAAARAVGLADGHSIMASCRNQKTISGGFQWRLFKADSIGVADVSNVRGNAKHKLNAR